MLVLGILLGFCWVGLSENVIFSQSLVKKLFSVKVVGVVYVNCLKTIGNILRNKKIENVA